MVVVVVVVVVAVAVAAVAARGVAAVVAGVVAVLVGCGVGGGGGGGGGGGCGGGAGGGGCRWLLAACGCWNHIAGMASFPSKMCWSFPSQQDPSCRLARRIRPCSRRSLGVKSWCVPVSETTDLGEACSTKPACNLRPSERVYADSLMH